MTKSQAAAHLMAKLDDIYNYYSDEVVGLKIMDFLVEELGMLPPLSEFEDHGHFIGDQFVYSLNEWEEE